MGFGAVPPVGFDGTEPCVGLVVAVPWLVAAGVLAAGVFAAGVALVDGSLPDGVVLAAGAALAVGVALAAEAALDAGAALALGTGGALAAGDADALTLGEGAVAVDSAAGWPGLPSMNIATTAAPARQKTTPIPTTFPTPPPFLAGTPSSPHAAAVCPGIPPAPLFPGPGPGARGAPSAAGAHVPVSVASERRTCSAESAPNWEANGARASAS